MPGPSKHRSSGQNSRSPGELAPNTLGMWHLVFFVVASAAPLMALATNSPVSISFGGVGAAGAFIVAGIVLAFFAAGFTAMSRFTKSSGAFYVYITRGLGRPIGMGASFLAVLAYNAIQIALYAGFAVFAQGILEHSFGIIVPWPLLILIAVVIVTFLGYFNLNLNANILAVALLLEIVMMGALAFSIVFHGGGSDGLTLEPVNPTNFFVPGAGAMFAFAFLSFIGFEATVIYGEEVKSPKRSIPRATYIAVAFLALFYSFVVWAVTNGFGLDKAVQVATDTPTEMYFLSVEQYLGGWARGTMELLIIVSYFAVILAFHNTVARYQFAVSREGLLPRILTKVHPKHRSPFVASFTQSLLAIIVTIVMAVAGADPFNDFYIPITAIGIYGILTLQVLTAIAVVAFFMRDRHGMGRVRTVVAPIVGGLGLFVMLLVALYNVEILSGRQGPANFLFTGCSFIVFIIGVFVALKVRRSRPEIYASFGQEREETATEPSEAEKSLN